ncbi:MAG TPA: NUDIX domain-containing protein [Rhabdochlamydiaceae bacterium]|jgi:8-oxo-dGTP pyrophosphatase MutT (NUDIX family)
MKKVESFGIVPIRRENQEWRVLLILHREGNHWGFPKGKANPGEQHRQTACRELKEETNLDVKEILHAEALIEQYQFRHKREKIHKTAYYFPALVEGILKCQEEEIREARWLPFTEALQQLSFKQARHILRETMRILNVELPQEEA